jgi:hypothetical protein
LVRYSRADLLKWLKRRTVDPERTAEVFGHNVEEASPARSEGRPGVAAGPKEFDEVPEGYRIFPHVARP